ncbi:hypothetical protein YM304_02280 [Ilumatobacter coccineus YM16-304]|uniref:AAA domain-containing protein n=1 Tax=Ilumatobacter coccineus (strain NBRC 103263 / KCTC 29153 / YM16-304) TaxID=1313172 RepID=A0A6C7E228_ILUCY|nr:hypothetical protein YM304_02280 [Ilumatobacter coccineus YM16-304]
MSRRTVAFASPKGGSGKSVTCLAYAQVIHALGFSVAVVDLDIETSGTTLLHLDQVLASKRSQGFGTPVGGAFDHEESERYAEVLLESGVILIPAQIELGEFSTDRTDAIGVVRDVLRATSGFDYVLLDLQAGADPVAVQAAMHADDVVIVSEFDPVSIQGVKRLERLYPEAFAKESTWILYNKVLPEIAKRMTDILRIERKLPAMPWTVEVVRSYLDGQIPVDMRLPNPFTLVVVEGVASLLGTEVGTAIAEWRMAAERTRREPIEDRLRQIDNELDELERDRIRAGSELEAQRRSGRMGLAAFWVSSVLVVFGVSLALTPDYRWVGGALSLLGLFSAGLAFTQRPVRGFVLRWVRLIAAPYMRLFRIGGHEGEDDWMERSGETELAVLERRIERRISELDRERTELSIATRSKSDSRSV